MTESSNGKSEPSGKTSRRTWGSALLDPNVSDAALDVERGSLSERPIDFNEWDHWSDRDHWPNDQDALSRWGARESQKRHQAEGKRHPFAWTRPCQWAEYRPPEDIPIEEFLQRDLIHWTPEPEDRTSDRWARVNHVLEVDGIVSVQFEALSRTGTALYWYDMVYDKGQLVQGRRWIEQ